jgi:hypothetical protein
MLTATRLRELLHYDPETGVFTWAVSAGTACAGAVAGSLNNRGYRAIMIGRRYYAAHRVIWLWMTGEWPKHEIDHINMDKGDNRWANLREATHSQNNANSSTYANNSSGFKGVHWFKRHRKWQAGIRINGKKTHLGYFDTPHQAYANYCLAARKYFGEYARVYEAAQLIIPRRVFEERVLRNLLAATQSQFEEAA